MDIKKHWEKIYSTNSPHELGWHEPHLQTSLSWINDLALPKDALIIDIGGGVSTLVDDLIVKGYKSITVLDLSRKALAMAHNRLEGSAESVTWLEGDVTTIELPQHYYRLWHDRAAFHFLVSLELQARYRENILNSLCQGGYALIGVFALEAPSTCSGLLVKRYSSESLAAVLGKDFELKKHDKKLHVTPNGVEQVYLYCLFQRLAIQSE